MSVPSSPESDLDTVEVQPPDVAALSPRRLAVYRIRPRTVVLDGYVFHALRKLGRCVDALIVLVPEALLNAVRAAVELELDVTVLAEEAIVSPQDLRHAVENVEARCGGVDDIIITDDSWFGPAGPLLPVLERMRAQRRSPWTMTASFDYPTEWIGIERGAFGVWGRGDAELGAALERTVSAARAAGAVAFPQAATAALAYEAGPLVPISLFTHPPEGLDLLNIARVLDDAGLSAGMLAQHLARHIDPRTLNARLALMSVLPVGVRSAPRTRPPMDIRVVVHVERGYGLDDIVPTIRLLAPISRIVATVANEDIDRVRRVFESHALDVDVRSVDPWEGQMGALIHGCGDLLCADGPDDLLVAIRVGAVRGCVPRAKQHRAQHSRDALFADAGHLEAVLDLFLADPRLGFVVPPTVAIGGDDLGAGWRGRAERAALLCRVLGVEVPLGIAPLEPPAGAWIARVTALAALRQHRLADPEHRRDMADDGALEAILAHAVGAEGFSSRTVIDPRGAAISQADLEYTLDQLAAAIRGTPTEQIKLLRRMGDLGDGSVKATLRAAWRRARADRRTPRS